MQTNAVLINLSDNVAVAIEEIKSGDAVLVAPGSKLKARVDIPRNHKVALVEIPANTPVIKYGEKIGLAKVRIQPGDWVHLHNLGPEGE